METLDNVRAESESSSNDTTDTTTSGLGTPDADSLASHADGGELSTGLADFEHSEEIEDEVDCFGDSGNGLARLSLQEGEKAT